MSVWFPWFAAFAVLVVLPVLLRWLAGDEPDNAVTQEQPSAGERDPAVQEPSAAGGEFRLIA